MKDLKKESKEQEKDIMIWIIWIKIFSFASPFKQNQITKYFKCEPMFNGVFSKKILPRIKDGAYVINQRK